MAISNMFSTVFQKASSFKKSTMDRLLSFTSTDSQGIELIAADPNLQPAPPPSSPATSTQPCPPANDVIIPVADLETESTDPLTQTSAAAAVETTGQQDFRKILNGVALGVVSVSFVLVINQLPASAQVHVLLVAAHNASVYLSFFLGGGLLLHSSLQSSTSSSTTVSSKTVNKVTVVAVVSLTLSFVLRACAVSPESSLLLSWVFFLAVFAILLLYIHFTRE